MAEVTDPQKSVLTMLNNLINRDVYKIFKVSDRDVICHIRDFVGLRDINVLYKERHEKFLMKTRVLTHAVLHSLIVPFL